MPAKTFHLDILYQRLFSLPTQHLNSLELTTVIISVLNHYKEPYEAFSGIYQSPKHQVQNHHWVLWGNNKVIDFRYPDLVSVDDGIQSWGLRQPFYRSIRQLDVSPIPMVLLPQYCDQEFAHFDHLANR